MSATNPEDITLALQKVTEGLTAIVDWPTDTNIVDIRQLLFPVLTKKKYDKLTLTYNLSRVILTTERYEHIYSKGAYSILPVIALYDDTIDRYATRTEVHQNKGKHEASRNERALWKTADTACKNFIMEVVDETWYKELKDTDAFYTNVTALKLLDHLNEFCSGLHTVDSVDIPLLTKTPFTNADGIPQFVNAMEAARRNPSGKNSSYRKIYACCGAETSTTARWVRNRNAGVVKNPWKPKNLAGVEGNLQGGICGK